jgi:hypothetical protein
MQQLMRSLIVAGTLAASPVMAQELDITITNLTQGSYFTPLLISAHAGGNHLFQAGVAASSHLQAMAEGGDISGLAADMAAIGADNQENPAGGLLAPGGSTQFSISTGSGNDHLSITAMLLPTNDGFVGLDALSIPSAAGTYRYTLNGYDAGTEANDEIVNGGGAPGVPGIPVDPGGVAGSGALGVTASEANTVVHIHRGVLGDTDVGGGASDLDSRVHRWLNPVAELVITVN